MTFSNKNLDQGKFSKKRFSQILKKYLAIENELKKEDFMSDLAEEAGIENKEASTLFENNPEITAHHAILIKRLSERMFKLDKKRAKEKQEELMNQQINWYYNFLIQKKSIMGHMEAVHGTAPEEKIIAWCKKMGVVDYDEYTNEIAQNGTNWVFFKKPRLATDVNHVPHSGLPSMMTEGAVFTNEYNINAIKAQRSLTEKILKYHHNLTRDKKAKNPYLAIYVHGKTDKHGHDFEIGARNKYGKGPINSALAFWIKKKLAEKIKRLKIKNKKGDFATVNVVTYAGFYAGSPALTRLRYGDCIYNFGGFGRSYQALQLECSWHVRANYFKKISKMLDETLVDFSRNFKLLTAIETIDKKYHQLYKLDQEEEKNDLFSKKHILFKDDIPKNIIGMSKSVKQELKITAGAKIKLFGKKFQVVKMNIKDLRRGKSILLHQIYRKDCGKILIIKN